jgi:hypothetical protein
MLLRIELAPRSVVEPIEKVGLVWNPIKMGLKRASPLPLLWILSDKIENFARQKNFDTYRAKVKVKEAVAPALNAIKSKKKILLGNF